MLERNGYTTRMVIEFVWKATRDPGIPPSPKATNIIKRIRELANDVNLYDRVT